MHHEHTHNRPSGVAWTALIFSIAALLLGFAAYDRTGANVDERIRTGFTEVREEADLRIARFEAASRLSSIEARREIDEDYPNLEEDVEEVRNDLEEAYKKAKLEGSEEWRELSSAFDNAAEALRAGGSNVRQLIEALIDNLRKATET